MPRRKYPFEDSSIALAAHRTLGCQARNILGLRVHHAFLKTCLEDLDGVGRTVAEGMLEVAEIAEGCAEHHFAAMLLLVWGQAANGDEVMGNSGTPPWFPCGVHIDGLMAWIEPHEITDWDLSACKGNRDEAEAYFKWDPDGATVHVVDLSRNGNAVLLQSPPCPILQPYPAEVLGGRYPRRLRCPRRLRRPPEPEPMHEGLLIYPE